MDKSKSFYHESELMVDFIINKLNINLDNNQEKQILGGYIFGMLNGLGREMKIEPADIQGVLIKISHDKLYYSLEASVQFSQFLINSTDRAFHPSMFSIIHKGLEGYYMYKNGEDNNLLKEFQMIINIVKSEGE